MAQANNNDHTDKSLVTAFILILFFATPFASLWARNSDAWYIPYMLWLLIIALLAVAQLRGKGNPSP
ncbi:hypothetical protein [Thiolapillus brandeum]|uniref:hypothetical protein n=1 Tax=Thiolapillus brandeum TaxID=1076588 RepID=UPI000596C237|nr:hypothetical protein [Thiolapillus brandeum]